MATNCQRLSSTTTRIKTHPRNRAVENPLCQRLSSTTTRIKTNMISFVKSIIGVVRDYLPLQQGLRLDKKAIVFYAH